MRLRLTPLASRDIAEARDWYSELSPSLGERFEQALDETFARILEHPRAFPVAHRRARRAIVVGRFSSYQVFFRAEGTDMVVVAVVHGSRRSEHWKRRV